MRWKGGRTLAFPAAPCSLPSTRGTRGRPAIRPSAAVRAWCACGRGPPAGVLIAGPPISPARDVVPWSGFLAIGVFELAHLLYFRTTDASGFSEAVQGRCGACCMWPMRMSITPSLVDRFAAGRRPRRLGGCQPRLVRALLQENTAGRLSRALLGLDHSCPARRQTLASHLICRPTRPVAMAGCFGRYQWGYPPEPAGAAGSFSASRLSRTPAPAFCRATMSMHPPALGQAPASRRNPPASNACASAGGFHPTSWPPALFATNSRPPRRGSPG